jgi:single-strand DNA-binding protein
MINRIVLTGRITKDLDLKTTQTGHSVVSFTLAVDRARKNDNGEREADFIRCVAWNKTAEVMSQYCGKGSLIGVDGHLQTRSYDDRNGQRVYITEVVVDRMSFLDSRNNQQGQQQPPAAPARQKPAPQPAQQEDPFAGSSDSVTVSDDDLPF